MSFEDGEEFKNFQENINEPFGIAMLKFLENKIPKGNYTFIIDAGALGGPQNAKYLSGEGRKFIISCSQSRINDVFTKYFHQILKLHETDVLYGNDFACACYFSGNSTGKKKFFNVLTNKVEELEKDEIKRWSKKEKMHISIETRAFINSYNKGHGFIDAFKARMVSVRNLEKKRRPFRTKMWDLLYTAINNSFIIYVNSHPNEKKITKTEYLEIILPHIRKQRESYVPPPMSFNRDNKKTLHVHPLQRFSKRVSCKICGKKTNFGCLKCSENQKEIHLCLHGYCALLKHNPEYNIKIG
jgi:hypothetical protein